MQIEPEQVLRCSGFRVWFIREDLQISLRDGVAMLKRSVDNVQLSNCAHRVRFVHNRHD